MALRFHSQVRNMQGLQKEFFKKFLTRNKKTILNVRFGTIDELATAQSRQPATQLPVQANPPTAGIKVQVVDPSGAVIPHASIQLTNERNKVLERGFTSYDGQLNLAVSFSGSYLLEVSAQGLEAHRRVNVTAGAQKLWCMRSSHQSPAWAESLAP
jgi:hypothetical protein